MVPIRELHYNADVFGENVDEFDSTRFLNNDLDKSPYFRPFAGGVTMCSGRFLAKRMTLVFVASLLHRFEIEVLGKDGVALETGKMPAHELDHVSPNMGIMGPMKGQEMYVRFSERKSD